MLTFDASLAILDTRTAYFLEREMIYMTFQDAKGEYERQREQERVSLAAYLAAHEGIKAAGLHVVTDSGAGRGSTRYSCNGKIPVFDLSNWKWVEVTGENGFVCAISLNMPDIAPETGTPVALYDRIGFIILPSPKEWIYTDIDLPLDQAKKEQIAQSVLAHFTAFCKSRKR